VLRTLAPVYAEVGRTTDAIDAYEEYIRMTGAEEARLGLARTLLNAGRYEDVLKQLEGVRMRSWRIRMYRAYGLARLGKLQEARQTIEAEPAGPSRQRRRLWAAVIVDSAPTSDGESELRRLHAEDPDDALLRSRLGYYLAVWGKKEQAEEAMSLLRAASTAVPHDLDLLSNLGWAAYRTGNDTASIEALENVLAKDPGRQLDRFRLAYPLRRSGERERAAKALQQALAVQPAASWAPEAKKMLREIAAEIARAAKSAPADRPKG
jgi:tetratricopeptide (TPR) repeat protein